MPENSSTSWFTPKRLLAVFCAINLLNYVDRGAIASNGVNGSISTCDDQGVCTAGAGIQGAFNLNNFEDGVLSSAFMVGLLVASPIFASLAKRNNPFRLIGVGLSVWTLATAGCGFSFDFWSIAICRMLVGVGEASFISLAAPYIDDNAPKSQKTAWLAVFYMCIPTGVALGYVYGGVVGTFLHWRYAFWMESLFMLPFAVLGFLVKPLQLKGFAPQSDQDSTVSLSNEDSAKAIDDKKPAEHSVEKISPSFVSQISAFYVDVKSILLDWVYLVNIIGYVSYNFVIGAYSYWGPKAGYNIYHMNDADLVFGAVTIVCGILGTLVGGFVLDRVGATISNAFKLLSLSTFLGAIACTVAFFMKGLNLFIALFALGELLVFATQAPVNYVCLHCVKQNLRPLSLALSTVCIHVFGDVPSSPLVGVLQDHLNDWRKTSIILTCVFFIAAAAWFVGTYIESADMSSADEENERLLVNESRQKV